MGIKKPQNISSDKFSYIKSNIIDKLKEDMMLLSPIKKTFFDMLLNKMFDLFSEDCSDDEIARSLNSLNNINSEYINPDDYISYDKAMEILHFGKNRAGFSNLMKIKGIKNKKINNVHIGFPKSEILSLVPQIEARNRKKDKKTVVKEKSEWKPSRFC